MNKSTIITILSILAFSVICYASQIYDSARDAGIGYYNNGQYQLAVQQFVSAQNIAPVSNDLSSWITKCNNKMVQSRNAKIQSRRKIQSIRLSNTQTRMQSIGQKILRYDSIGHYGSSNLALARYHNKYGFIDKDSIIVVPLRYDDVYSIITEAIPGTDYDNFIKAHNLKWNWSWDKGQLMSVSTNGKWGYINEAGKEVIPIIYDDVRESLVFKGRNLIGVGQNGKYGFVDWNGNVKIPLEYDYVSRYYNGAFGTKLNYDMVPVVKNGKMGFIDDNGKTVIPFEYEPQYNLEYSIPVMFRPVWLDGITDLKKDGKFGIVDSKGNSITGFKYDGKGEVELANVNGDYIPYYIFPYKNKKIFFFQGKEFDSEEAFNQELTRLTLTTQQTNSHIPQVKIIDSEKQAKDPDYKALKLFKEEITKLNATDRIKKFNYFSEGVAVIELEKGICLLFTDKESSILKDVSVYWPHYNSGLLGCCYDRAHANSSLDGFYLNKNGKIAISRIKLSNGNETVIGASFGKKISAGSFNNKYAVTWHYKGTDARHGLINLDGELVVPCKYDNIYPVKGGYVAEQGNDILFIDDKLVTIRKIKRAIINELSYNEFTIYEPDCSVSAEKNRRYNGDFTLLETSYTRLFLSNNDNRHLWKLISYNYYDDHGEIVVPQNGWSDAKEFNEGLAAVCINNHWGYIDTSGNIVIKPMFEDAGSFADGIAWVKNGGVYYYIDNTGKFINNEKYSYADDFHEGFGIVKKNNQYGIVAKSGLSTFDII